MSMQEEGFVQLPLSKYHELLELEKRKDSLQEDYNKLLISNRERDRSIRNLIRFSDERYLDTQGIVIHLTIDEVKLLEFLGIPKILKEELNNTFYIQRITTYVSSIEKDKYKFLAEKVNNCE